MVTTVVGEMGKAEIVIVEISDPGARGLSTNRESSLEARKPGPN